MLYALTVGIISFFVATAFICSAKDHTYQGSYFGPLYLAIMNVIVWILLSVSTLSFVRMLNKRFGEKEFSGPKRRLIFFLVIFSLSFFVRGAWDTYIAIVSSPNWSKPAMALSIFIVYFLTEWLPVFVIFLAHLLAFRDQIKKRQRLQSEQGLNDQSKEE